ncbi:MAG: proline--tRNA ligase [Gemmatimonadetes bacterium]|uniref:Proline--tRNA ligase n=1 Tax=Candidatus Kutchimonas denitrificans TaxID=3056748 RepID=A0AAE4ZA21_9BACT|nr:proline--tRNA ligase [Gemmatimonadota bacterium]NIR75823.1 proline--tRNA ligase [Candidatus Kutchimonas denitrificans]NIS01991.1 proline--tRNA ligase [Gemmatimonadota bacterium]NIT67795.1 proline--tRNA ligase [Gemmatimonadota bacterium]NIU53782.1 proline--tRNA ligase [Gemmatimonadota bacterium]
MRLSKFLGPTLRSAPAGAETKSHGLLLRAGYIRPLAPGIFSYLPLGRRALRKIEAVVRAELEALGAQEVTMPGVQPATLVRRSGLWEGAGPELARFDDRCGRPLALAMSHEENAAFLAADSVTSYRQLPVTLFQIGRCFRDEARPRGGIARLREFTLLDSYSFSAGEEGLAAAYRDHLEAFDRIFSRLGLARAVLVESGGGAGTEHDFFYPSEAGDDAIVQCDACGYAADREWARFARPEPPVEEPQPLERVSTPGASSIEGLAKFLDIPESRTAKVVLLNAIQPTAPDDPDRREVLVMALVRGDMEVSEAKLRQAVGALALEPARGGAIEAAGATAGYASPVGLPSSELRVVIDELVATTPNLVAGANEEGVHLRNVNFGRDYRADVVADIALAREDAACPDCTRPLRPHVGFELGSLHRFPADYAERLGATYQDNSGSVAPMRMGSYGIGLDRLLACIAEEHHDERGLVMPATVAPFAVHLVSIAGGDPWIEKRATELYEELVRAGFDTLYDDRDLRAGVKFNDADLMGAPVRVSIGARSLERDGVEVKRRAEEKGAIVDLDNVLERAAGMLADARGKLGPE